MNNNILYIEHILIALNKVVDYVGEGTEKDFLDNEQLQDAVIRNFEIVGEATKKIDNTIKSKYVSVPWKQMAGMRDKLIHDYFGVDINVVWETVQNIVPIIIALKEIIEKENI